MRGDDPNGTRDARSSGRFAGMRTTIDGSGRVVVPKAIRRRLGLEGGEPLDIEEIDGTIVLRPAPLEVEIVDTPHGPRAQPREPVAALDDDTVRSVLERLRR